MMCHATMKAAILSAVGLFLSAAVLAADEPKLPEGGKEFRSQCRAHLVYTAALAEEASKTRMTLLTKAIELDPRLARAYYNRGFLYANQGDLRRAKADFLKAVDLDESYIHAHYNLACVHSLASRPEEALASLEAALAKGYQKFDKISSDEDLKSIREKPAFAPLIAKYKALAATTKLGSVQRFQTADVEGRAELLAEALRKPDKEGPELARWAMQEADHQLRVLSMQLWRKLDVAQSKPALMRGLYDSNGYVNKAAANNLIGYGKDIAPWMMWALEDKEAETPFYAMQVLAAIDYREGAERIVRFLRDEKPSTRIVAAESLARLRAASALPQLEAALENLPKEEREQEFYKAAVRRAIGALKQAKEGPQK
jgi:tetratricopeptide (TPR) repeat protein